jgi:hypothetical protein
MKNFFNLLFTGLMACGPDRSFEGKNLYGSQTAVTSSASSGYIEPPWPEGDQGIGLGKIVPEQMAWQGYTENQSNPSPTTLWSRDWYDPTGELEINAVMVIVAKHDCVKCKEEAEFLENRVTAWKSQGRMIKVTTLLIDSKDGKSASWTDALEWKKTYYQVDLSVGADPLQTFLPYDILAYPYHAVINPRTMRVIETQEGLIDKYDNLEKLSDSNAK